MAKRTIRIKRTAAAKVVARWYVEALMDEPRDDIAIWAMDAVFDGLPGYKDASLGDLQREFDEYEDAEAPERYLVVPDDARGLGEKAAMRRIFGE